MPRIFSATYQPYTYEELAAPVREATAAHQAVEQNFDTLMTDADKMRAFLNEDWQSYKDYKEYVDQLNAAAYDLARNGLTRQNRGNLLQLKRNYNGKIQAINAGILSRQNEIETFKKSAKGQSSRYIGPRPEDYSVDEYMYGNNPFKMGVDGSEIYSYADEQAKASTSRRYQEFTEGGKWRITEVGVDPNTTSMVMDALRTGKNFTDPEYTLLAQNNPRQFQYMQAVLDDMRGIADNARETFGYGQFGQLNDNGDEKIIPTPNQLKFDAEIFGGLNKGIQYDRKSYADPYAKAAYDSALREQEAQNDFQRDLLKKGLENGSLVWNPTTGKIVANPNANSGSGNGGGYIDTPDFKPRPMAVRNEDVTESLNTLGIKGSDIVIDDDGTGVPRISGFRDQNIGKLGIRDDNGNIIDNKIDLYVWANIDGDATEANRVINKIQQTTANERQFSNNGNYETLEHYMNRLSQRNNLSSKQREMLNEYVKAKKISDENKRRYNSIPKEYRISDKEYNKIRSSFGADDESRFTMDDMERLYMYRSDKRPQFIDSKYTISGPTLMGNSGGRELNNYAKRLLGGLQSGFGENEDDVIEYQKASNDTYSVARKKKFSDADEYTKKDGILQSAIELNVTKGMLMNTDSEGNLNPLVEIIYLDSRGKTASKIIPMTRLGGVMYEYLPLARKLKATYGEYNPNDFNTQMYIDQDIRTTLQNIYDKYK